jgi:transposase
MPRPPKVTLLNEEREALEAMSRARSLPAREVMRARIVLKSAQGLSAPQIATQLECDVNSVRQWRSRFLARRLEGLAERPRSGRPAQFVGEREAQVLAQTLEAPAHASHWSTRRLGKQAGVSKSTVHRIWRRYDLQPHREKTFKFSRDPLLVEKVVDVVGLYLNPPENALVLCVDEKTQIQAMERTQPLLPMQPGRPAARTHDYERNGTTTLFAALDKATGEVLGRCAQRHRHQEFLTFLRLIDRTYPHGEIHFVLDNYSTHTHDRVKRWFERHPRFVSHFTPTGASWLNLAECWFSILTRQRVRRGSFTSIMALVKSIHSYLRAWERNPTPFAWTKTPQQVLAPYHLNTSGTGH